MNFNPLALALPAEASRMVTAPSSTRNDRSTSMVKSTCPTKRVRACATLATYAHSPGHTKRTRCIDEIDSMLVPRNGDRRRRDGDATLAFLFHVIHGGVPIVHVAHRSNETGMIEHAFDRGGFSLRREQRQSACLSHSSVTHLRRYGR